MNNALALLKILNLVVTVAANANDTIQKISMVLSKAQAEGRDVTDEELASLASETDKLTQDAKTILAGL